MTKEMMSRVGGRGVHFVRDFTANWTGVRAWAHMVSSTCRGGLQHVEVCATIDNHQYYFNTHYHTATHLLSIPRLNPLVEPLVCVLGVQVDG